MTDNTDTVYAKNDIDQPWSIMLSVVCDKKTRKENDMTDHTDSIYVQNKIELS